MSRFELVVKGGTCVDSNWTARADLGIREGRLVAIAEEIAAADGDRVIDARGLVVLPGGVDAHAHFGIYRPLREDVESESRSSLVGGVTTVLSYFRTGSHYLNRTGPYREILPEVIKAAEGASHVDVRFHLAPMSAAHVAEIPWLVEEGVRGFKYYMFYQGFNLAGNSRDARGYTGADDYDLGHLYEIMEAVAGVDQGGDRVSVSIHCEQPELLRLFIDRIQRSGRAQDLSAYSDARPPVAEQVAIAEAVALAGATGAPVNLLHLSSREALDAAIAGKRVNVGRDIRLETTLHHLALAHDELRGLGGKVNPPIRTRADNEAMWRGLAAGDINWVASDHACCTLDHKGEELWPALPGFGGSGLLYPVLISEGFHKRRLPLSRVVDAVSSSPARAYGLYPRKGSLRVGADADLAIVDLDASRPVTAGSLLSDQDHSPFEGMEIRGWPVTTILRGTVVFEHGRVAAPPTGRVLMGAPTSDVRPDSPTVLSEVG